MGLFSYPLINERDEPDAFTPRESGVAIVPRAPDPEPPMVDADYVPPRAYSGATSFSFDNGDKFEGGFGLTQLLTADYWTLRARSSQLFETNLYARGLIRRLVTNEIHTGLYPEASPEEKVIGVPDRSLQEWSEDVETRFGLWANDPWLCDHAEQATYGALQAEARREALVAGDVLVVLRQYQPTGLPRVQLISGSLVQSPMELPQKGNKITHGVEQDSNGRHVAYWVRQDDGSSKRLPAWGEKSGRKLAWMVYGTDKRLDGVRGKPLLSLVLQALREIDRYRDAAIRKAVLNSLLAMFVQRNEPSQPSLPFTGAAQRKDKVTVTDSGMDTGARLPVSELAPGMLLQNLAVGEEIKAHAANGTDEKLGAFEEVIMATVAWAHETPPEILRLSFSSNYSASQAAINEFKMYLTKARTDFGANFCQPIYVEWLIAQVLAKKIRAPGLIESWRDVKKYDVFAAWTAVDWAGAIKPAVDMSKLVNGYEKLLAIGGITRARMTRELTGMKYSKVIKQLRQENQDLADVLAPLLAVQGIEPKSTTPPDPPDKPLDNEGNHPDDPEHQESDA